MAVEQYFRERDSPRERGVLGRVYETLVKRFSPGELDTALPRLAFLMLKPDALVRGLGVAIAKELAARGLYPVCGREASLTGRVIDEFYVFVKEKYASTWWVMGKTYSLGPAYAMILVGDPGGFEHLPARLRQEVGPTTPIVGGESQVRYMFRGTNRVLNLVHAADDPAVSARESLVFFSVEELAQAMEKTRVLSALSAEGEMVLAQLSSYTRLQNLCSSRVALDVKTRLLEEVRVLGVKTGLITGEGLHPLRKAIEREEEVVMRELPLRGERRLLQPILGEEYEALKIMFEEARASLCRRARETVVGEDPGEVFRSGPCLLDLLLVLRDLASEEEMLKSQFDAQIARLASCGVRLSGLEERVLHSGWATLPQVISDMKAYGVA